MSSSHERKRPKLSSPVADIETIPISDESGDEDQPKLIPFIKIEDISSDDSDSAEQKSRCRKSHAISELRLEAKPSLDLNSPLKLLSQSNLLDSSHRKSSICSLEPTSTTSPCNIEVSKADSQSNVISTTTMLSPFHCESKVSTLGSPRYMVQEISSTVQAKMLTTLSGKLETKERIKIMIKQLGGEYIDSPNFVERCTHIVLGKPNTGEKYMGGLITGKWLLKTEYVEESYAEGYWLEEDSYEWTKDAIEKLTSNTDPELAKLASSARRCRLRYSAEGPFHDMTASILSDHPRRLECYERLFKAGGGRVINIQDYRKRHKELSFILVDNPDQTHIPLKNPSVPLLRISYIHNIVLEETKPDIAGYRVKREEAQNVLPTVPWTCTFSRIRKEINLTSKKCPRKVVDYIDGVTCAESWGAILLPLTNNQAPPAHMLRSVIKKSLLPVTQFGPLRQVLSDLHILSWFIPPSHVNRDYYVNLLQVVDKKDDVPHNADKFIALLEDAVRKEGSRRHPQSHRYLMFWLELLEKDFWNWERRPNNMKPLCERILNSWHYIKHVLKVFLRAYMVVMTNDHVSDRLKLAMNSQLIVYFTSNEIKRKATKKEDRYQAGTIIDRIGESVCRVVMATLKLNDVRRLHMLVHMLSFSYTLVIVVFNKVLVSLNHSLVPEYFKVLSSRPPSWEKFYNFYLYVRYDAPDAPSSTFTSEVYLILLAAMFRSLLADLSKPPSELNPLDKTLDFQRTMTRDCDISPSGKLILKLLIKSIQ